MKESPVRKVKALVTAKKKETENRGLEANELHLNHASHTFYKCRPEILPCQGNLSGPFFEIMRRPLQARTAGIYIFLERGRDWSLMRNLTWLATSLMNCKEYVENKNFIKINFLFHHFLSFSGQHQSFFSYLNHFIYLSYMTHTHEMTPPTPLSKKFSHI